MGKQHYWVYILKCHNGSYYTGYTNDLERRYAEHQQGTAKCKYTRSFKPLEIVQSWEIADDKLWALKAERLIKKMNRQQKEQLIREPGRLERLLEGVDQVRISNPPIKITRERTC